VRIKFVWPNLFGSFIFEEVMSDNLVSGVVKWFNDKKGFGFIEQENGPDVFVHFRAIKSEGFRTLKDGQSVKFKVVDGAKGLQAEEVELT